MVKFDWSSFFFGAKENYSHEVKNSKEIQDEVKKYNERFPSWFEPLYELDQRITDAASSGGSVGEFSEGMIVGDNYEEQAWSYFLGKDFHKKCIAGIMGNFEQESGTNPKTIQGGGKGPGTGLVQWGDSMDGGRWNSLVAWANKEGKDEWDMLTQLDYLWIEMKQTYHLNLMAGYLRQFGYSPGNDTLKAFSKVDNIEHAMKIFELTIERAGHKAYSNRLRYANAFYEKYKDWDPDMSVGVLSSSGLVEPYRTSYTVTSEYGMRQLDGQARRLHAGIDLSKGAGTPIYPVANGRVVMNEWGNSPGWNIVIDHGEINGKQIFSRYMHLISKSSLSVGQTVNINTQIGNEGNTGASFGAHLHLEIQEQAPGSTYSYGHHVNPRNHINFSGKGRS